MSPPRKFSGKVKPGMGIDGTEGENALRPGKPWDTNPRGDFISRDGGRYTYNRPVLRNKMPVEDPEQGKYRGGQRDIWSDVEGQSSDDGNRIVRSGSED
jgi:hypothetical protein